MRQGRTEVALPYLYLLTGFETTYVLRTRLVVSCTGGYIRPS